MRSPSINWIRGIFRLYIMGSVLFLGYFAVVQWLNASRPLYTHNCSSYRVTDEAKCESVLKSQKKRVADCIKERLKTFPDNSAESRKEHCEYIYGDGYDTRESLSKTFQAFWFYFDNWFFGWLFFSVAGWIILFVGYWSITWVIKGFKKDEGPKTETAPSVDENLVSKAKKIREDITDNS